METINGYVEHIIFQNGENGYTVFHLVSGEEEITCVGMCKGLTQGENIAAQGEYIEHPVYGKQLKLSAYQVEAPKDSISMERYLASGAVKGIGTALAARIVKKFGNDTFRIIEEEPERLTEAKGRHRKLLCKWRKKRICGKRLSICSSLEFLIRWQ